jgi:hypothetical protein
VAEGTGAVWEELVGAEEVLSGAGAGTVDGDGDGDGDGDDAGDGDGNLGNRKMIYSGCNERFVQGFPLGAAVSCELCLHFGQYS